MPVCLGFIPSNSTCRLNTCKEFLEKDNSVQFKEHVSIKTSVIFFVFLDSLAYNILLLLLILSPVIIIKPESKNDSGVPLIIIIMIITIIMIY